MCQALWPNLNTTGSVKLSADHDAFDDSHENFIVCISTFSYVHIIPTSLILLWGSCINLFVLIELINTPLGSLLTKALLCNQCVLDCLACAYLAYNAYPRLWSKQMSSVKCHLIENTVLLRIVRLAITSNVCCITLDKLLAVCCAQHYKRRTKVHLAICYIFIFTYTSCALFANSGGTRYSENGLCVTVDDDPVLMALEILLQFVLPAAFILATHFIIRSRLSGCHSGRGGSVTRQHTFVDEESRTAHTEPTSDNGASSFPVKNNIEFQAQTAIAIGTFGYIATTPLVKLLELLLAILGLFHIIDFSARSMFRYYYYFVCGLLMCMHPLILVGSLRAIQETIVKHGRVCRSKILSWLVK
ncbi:hypothetical protein CSKR_105067 [Clonorchis sinensis]|uniref:Uncharacterized protein n=2 Tax=Clonorchis sinensis TaxID=79923 RepID=G7YK81_CLOSI|nr:hypothetical protein CSKR_105067 [Clonorchis sinensis]GAA53363.1 hypothetical protein CLF_110082 [Clonorchis sinensis]